MKKILAAVLAVLMLLALCSCGKTAGAKLNLGSSEIYSDAEIKAAAAAVKREFMTMDGCTLYSLSYAGDEAAADNLEYVRQFDKAYDKCVVFESSFRSPKNGGGTWEKDAEYTWRWYAAKSPLGGWKVAAYGYG